MPGLDLETVRHALEVARQNRFAEVEIRAGDDAFTAVLKPTRPAPAAAQSTEPSGPTHEFLTAPCVGYYRTNGEPLCVGQTISTGQIVATIVALGIANDVESRHTGVISEVLVDADQAVEFGQHLAVIEVSEVA